MHKGFSSFALVAVWLMLAGQAAAISIEKLTSWVEKFERVELDWEAPLGDRKNLRPLTIPISGENVTMILSANSALFESGAVGVPNSINEDLLTGTVEGQEDDPESYVSLTIWPIGLNGRVSFRDSNGKRQLVHIDRLDGTATTILYNDVDIRRGLPVTSPLESQFRRRSRFWKRQSTARSTAAAGKDCGIAVVADSSFVAKFGNDSVKQMSSIMNDVQGFYDRAFNVGVPIALAVVDTGNELNLGNNGIGSVGNISLALDQLAAAVGGTALIPEEKNRELCTVHLFTDRQFGETLGLAFVGNPTPGEDGGICTGEFSTGVTTALGADGIELPQASWVTAVTHEIGHSFGSGHDEDIGCGGQRNIMSATVDSTGIPVTTFSTCSLEAITNTLQTKSGCFRERNT